MKTLYKKSIKSLYKTRHQFATKEPHIKYKYDLRIRDLDQIVKKSTPSTGIIAPVPRL